MFDNLMEEVLAIDISMVHLRHRPNFVVIRHFKLMFLILQIRFNDVFWLADHYYCYQFLCRHLHNIYRSLGITFTYPRSGELLARL